VGGGTGRRVRGALDHQPHGVHAYGSVNSVASSGSALLRDFYDVVWVRRRDRRPDSGDMEARALMARLACYLAWAVCSLLRPRRVSGSALKIELRISLTNPRRSNCLENQDGCFFPTFSPHPPRSTVPKSDAITKTVKLIGYAARRSTRRSSPAPAETG